MAPDFINGLFQISASIFVAYNCKVVIDDGEVKGVSVISTSFFMLWSVWNLIYYPAIGQYWSYLGGVCLAISNLCWVGLLYHYKCRVKKEGRPPMRGEVNEVLVAAE